MFDVGLVGLDSEVPKPFHSSTEPMFSSSKEQSTIIREKVDSISPPVFNMVSY